MTRLSKIVRAGEEGRLDDLLMPWLATALDRPLSKSSIRRLIMAGAVRVDGRPARRPGLIVSAGTRLDAAIDERRLPLSPSEQPVPTVTVLYEDEALIAVAKPAGLPTHATADRARADLFTLVRAHLAEASHPPMTGLPYLGLHHRLDRDTSGAVLFTKLPSANAALAAQFASHSIVKVYHAITAPPATPAHRESWLITNRLASSGTGRRSRMTAAGDRGQPAETSIRVLERYAGALLVEARPRTGRKHQVRAHLSGCGLPIAGDERYGGPLRLAGIQIPRPLLHARHLSLTHPLAGTPLEITCDYPDDYRLVLQRLRRTVEAKPAPPR
jgi:23S rRNA pseudouridine1911/1915/1917 synthase